MITLNVMDTQIFVGTREECREAWRSEPDKRGRLYLEEEIDLIALLDPEHLARVIQLKMDHPGTVLTKELVERVTPT